MANEADLKLIQIPEFPKTDTLVGSGPEYVVLTKADGVTYGMLTEDFKAFLGTVQVQVPKALAPTDPAPTLSAVYYPTVTQNEAGTPIIYANAGGISVNTAEGGADHNSMVQLIYDGSSWVKVNVPIEVPEPDLSGLVEKSSIVNNLEEGGSNKVASAEIVKTLRGNIEALATVRTGANLIDPSKIVRGKRVGTVASGGNIYPFELGIMTDYIPVEEGVMYGLVGINQNVSSFFQEIGDTVPVYTVASINVTVPEGLGIKYMVANISITGNEASIGSAMIYKRTGGAIPYEPYTEEWKIKPSALPSEGDIRELTVPLTWGTFATATGNAGTRPVNFNRVITFDFYKTEGVNQISVASGYTVTFYAFNEPEEGTFIYRSGSAQSHAKSAFESYNYLRFIVQKVSDAPITIQDIQDINLTLGLSVEAGEYTADKSEVILVDIVRGALSANGSVINNNTTSAQDRDEFYKNFKTQKFIRVDGRLNSSIWVDQTGLSAYTLLLFEFDRNHSPIGFSSVTDADHEINANTRYVRLHGYKADLSDIDHLPNIRIRAAWSGDIYGYSTIPYGKTERLVIQVGNYNGRDAMNEFDVNSPDPDPQYDNSDYYTHLIIRTPQNYSPDGQPVRVMYYAHGSDSSANVNDFSASYLEYVKYLVDEGFMLVNVFAWSNKYQNAEQNVGTPTNIACVNSMYRFISENYNIKRDGVFVMGKSIGGIPVYSAEYAYNFPVLAGAALSGTLESTSGLFGYVDAERLAVVEDLGIPEDPADILQANGHENYNDLVSRAWIRRNATYFYNINPITMGAVGLTLDQIFPDRGTLYDYFFDLDYTVISRVPVKSWLSPEETIRTRYVLARKKAVEKGGGIFEVKFAPTGTGDPHHAVDTMDKVVPQVVTKLGHIHYNVPVTYAEVIQFFRRFEI